MSINIARGVKETHDPRYEFTMADRMRKAVQESGMSVESIALRIQVHRNTVGNWINGRAVRIKERDLKEFAKVTKYDLAWLISGIRSNDYDADGQHSLHFRSSHATVRPSQPKDALVTPIRRRHHE